MAEHINDQLSMLEKTIQPKTSFEGEKEEYILKPSEEEDAISYAIERAKDHFEWKMKDKGLHEGSWKDAMAKINWIEKIDRTQVLQTANSAKHRQLWEADQLRKEKEVDEEKRNAIKKFWTAGRMLQLMRHNSLHEHGKPLIENEHTFPLIKTVCLFLSDDERFEKELGYSFKKGLLLRGVSGLGKTHTVECIKRNELNPVSIVSMLEIAECVKDEGEFNIPTNCSKLYIDDVGTEEATVNHFGTRINWFKQFIEIFYLRSKHYKSLIISTNCPAAEIEEKYGFRVRSRIKEMFNVVDVTGKDLRG